MKNLLFFATKKHYQANPHLLLEEPTGSMLTAKVHVFSDSVSAQVPSRWIQSVFQHFGNRRQKLS